MTATVNLQRKLKELSIDDVIKKINFKVETREIFLKGEVPIENRQAIYRPDNKRVLSVVSDKYSLLENAEVFTAPLEAVTDKQSGFFVRRFEVQKFGGRTVIECLSKTDYKVPNSKGDEETYKKRVLLVNSYDKSSSLKILYGAHRLICSNGAGVWFGGKAASFRVVHVGNNKNSQLNTKANIIAALEQYEKSFHLYLDNISLLSKTKLKTEQLEKIFLDLGLKEAAGDKIEKVVEKDYSKDLSLLSIYHAVTQLYRDKEEEKETVSLRYFKKTAQIMGGLIAYGNSKKVA